MSQAPSSPPDMNCPTDRPWLAHYPAGVAADIEDQGNRTLVDIFEESCRRFADKVAYTNLGVELSYAELQRQSAHFASFLQHELGFAKGDRIALMMPNLLQYPIALFGILRAGMVVVNVNPMYTARELEHQLVDAEVRGIVIVENFATTLEQVRERVNLEAIITTQIGDCLSPLKRLLTNLAVKYIKKMVPAFTLPDAITFNTALARGARKPLQAPTIDADDVAVLQYTGGTTGAAKGAILLHRNIVANMAQCSMWIKPTTEPGKERIITALPLYHVFALTANCLVFLQLGGNNALVTDPRNIPQLAKTFARHKPTAFTGVNTLFNALANDASFRRLDFSALRLALGGGAAVQRAVAKKWKRITGIPIIEAYGLTETSPAAVINPLDLTDYTGSIGLPIPSTRALICDDDGNAVATGEPGELCIAGPQVMAGYHKRPEETAKSFLAGGYFRTGDIAKMDADGFFYIIDRKKDMILVSGFNVYPNEVEDVVAGHPGVREAACVGMADAKSGEAVKLFVVRSDASTSKDSIMAFCREELTAYKVPKEIVFVDDLPKSNVGKVLRKDLRGQE
ncbi:MAG TPA: AMP-binding protein [Salinisphaeraceae bacterium]|nr:AMP-binding protein [Salinisphaeraceae bacterium]